MATKFPSKAEILRSLYKLQKDIWVIYRTSKEDGWGDRCLLFSKEYSPRKEYNHRNILTKEIVLEYDFDTDLNNLLANKVVDRYRKFGIKCYKAKSGNSSKHVHCFVDIPSTITDLSTFKRVFMNYFGVFYFDQVTKRHYYEKGEVPKEHWDGWVNKTTKEFVMIEKDHGMPNKDWLEPRMKKVYPDMQLAGNHPIRLEYGLHEKTGRYKTMEMMDEGSLKLQKIPTIILEKYGKEKTRMAKYAATKAINSKLADSPVVKELLDTVKFIEQHDDKRERIMFCLIHILKGKYEEEELKILLKDWYKYTKGTKMSAQQIERKVDYHYKKDYTITHSYLRRVIEE